MKNLILTLALFAAFLGSALATNFETISNGDWNRNSTWKNNNKPGTWWNSSSTVTIKHAITLDKDISFEGTLNIQAGASLTGSNKNISVDQNGEFIANGVVSVKNLTFWRAKQSTFSKQVTVSNTLDIENSTVTFSDFVSAKKLETYLSDVTFTDSVYVSNEIDLDGNTVTFDDGLYSNNKFSAYQCTINLNGYNYFRRIANGSNTKLNECVFNSSLYTYVDEDFRIWEGTINNSGLLIVDDELVTEAKAFNNSGTITVDDFVNEWAGVFTNNGNLFITNDLENNNTFTNNDSIYVGADFNNLWGGDVFNYGCIHINGELVNNYNYTDYEGSCFYANGDVELDWGQNITTDGDFNAASDLINKGGTIRINGNGKLKVNKKFENQYGSSLVNNGELIIGSGGYMINKNGSSKSGNGVDSKQRVIAGKGWHYISAPVNNAKSSNAFWGAALYQFNEVSNQWEPIGANQKLQAMKGYDVYYHNEQEIKFQGKFHDGNYSIDLTKENDGWNLVGNPYPSTIDWQAVSGWTKTNVDNAIYIWDPATQNITTYINGAGTNGGTRYVAPMQGFLVRCNNSNGGSLSINNNARVEQSVVFRGEENEDLLIRVTVSSDKYNDETVIRYHENATASFDFNYDAEKMFSKNSDVPQIYSKSVEGTDASINSIPTTAVGSSVPVYFKAGVTGSHEVKIDLENFDYGTMIYLEDKMTGEVHDMLTGSFEFESEVTDDPHRFIVHFIPPQSVNNQGQNDIYTSIDDKITDETVNVYAENKTIHVTNNMDNAQITIVNLVGKVVYKDDNLTEGYSAISTNLDAGYYIVNITNPENKVSQKLYIR
jgi:formylmethanofuran dehydrogenase subunit C